MEQGNSVADSLDTTDVPSGTSGSGAGGVAGGGLTAEQLDALLSKRLAQFKGEVVKETSDQVWRGTQRVMDQRFARIEPAFGQLSREVQEIRGHFQKAEEETLDPDERRQREADRRFQDMQQREYNAALRARQWQAHANVQRALRAANVDEQDGRLQEMWNDQLQQTDPDGWALTMVTTIAQLGRQDEANRGRTAADAQTQAERRRAAQLEEQNKTLANNQRRQEGAGHLETQMPSGEAMDWVAKYNALKAAGDHNGARKFIEAKANQARRGQVKRPEQF